MKPTLTRVIILVAIGIGILGFGLITFAIGQNYGYSTGYTNGHADGYRSGYADGKTNGYSSGHSDGYNSGHTDGYNTGVTAGYQQGLSAAQSLSTVSNNQLIDMLDWMTASCTKYSNGYYQVTMWKDSSDAVHYNCLVSSYP
jgi:hypothetical protein